MRSESSPNLIPDTEAPAPGFGLARRVARRTTDLLAIAIVAIAGLSVGGRLIEWWSTEPGDVTHSLPAGSTGHWGARAVPVVFEFGEQPFALTRQSIDGDGPRAAEALRNWCRQRVSQLPTPTGDVSAAERKLLDRIATAPGSTEVVGHGRIVWLDEPLPLAVGLASAVGRVAGVETESSERSFRQRVQTNSAGGSQSLDPSHLGSTADIRQHPDTNPGAVPAERVVCWGMVFPAGDDGWTLFGFEFQDHSAPATGQQSHFLLPPGSHRLLAFDDRTLGGLAAFEGTGPVKSWIAFYRHEAEQSGWTLAQPWRARGSSYGARYRTTGNSPAEIDIQITPQPGNGLLGLLNIERRIGPEENK